MDDYTFTVRPIAPDELDAWWELRLQGLRDHPNAFGADYEESKRQGPDHLRKRVFGDGVDRLFGGFTRDGQLVAQAAVASNAGKRRHIATIYGVHTDPAWRGRGLSRALIGLVIAHCQTFPHLRQLTLSVNARNQPAISVYTDAEFVAWGTEPRAIATDDGFHDEMHMVRMLDEG